jgi:hypothetical protein
MEGRIGLIVKAALVVPLLLLGWSVGTVETGNVILPANMQAAPLHQIK